MAYQPLSVKKTHHFSFRRAIHVLFSITLWDPGRSGWGAGTTLWVCVSLFRISKPIIARIQEKTMPQLVCCSLACEQGGPGGEGEGKSSPHSLPFSPTPLGELACVLFTTVLALVFITVIVSTLLCVICNYFSCLIISRPCCLSEFYPNSTSSSCGRDDEIDPSSRRSTDRRLKCTLFYFAGAWKLCGDTLSELTLTMSMCGRVLRI